MIPYRTSSTCSSHVAGLYAVNWLMLHLLETTDDLEVLEQVLRWAAREKVTQAWFGWLKSYSEAQASDG